MENRFGLETRNSDSEEARWRLRQVSDSVQGNNDELRTAFLVFDREEQVYRRF